MRQLFALLLRQLTRRSKSLLLLLAATAVYFHVVGKIVFGVKASSSASSSSAAPNSPLSKLSSLDPSSSSHGLDLFPDLFLHRLDLGGGDWTVRSENGSDGPAVKATVPGGVYSDLEAAGRLGKEGIYYRYNDVEFDWVSETNWVYEKTFSVPSSFRDRDRVVLNLDGVDTVADVLLNGRNVGTVDNMFARHRFDVKELLRFEGKSNHLVLAFESPVKYAEREFEHHKANRYIVPPEKLWQYMNGHSHANFIRKMQCSFGWDVTPSYPSSGIFKPIFLEGFDSASIQYIKFTSHPSAQLSTAGRRGISTWKSFISVVLDGKRDFRGRARVTIANDTSVLLDKTREVRAKPSPSDGAPFFELEETVEGAETWWPNGLGSQPLYYLTVSLLSPSGDSASFSGKTVRVGFRVVALHQTPVSEVVGDEEAEGATFHFKANGRAFFAKGANLAPFHALPEGVTKKTVDEALQFAADSHMNMLRVWGQGMYESDYLYSRADELGLLMWQDFAFGNSMYPATPQFLQNVQKEAIHQARRLQHHASLALFCGNNENERALAQNEFNTFHENRTEEEWRGDFADVRQYYSDYVSLYAETIGGAVGAEAPEVPYLTSTPTEGDESARQGYVSEDANGELFGTMHFYDRKDNMWTAAPHPVPRFMDEYGYQSYPAVSTLQKYAVVEDLHWTSRFINHRQHGTNAQDDLIKVVSMHFDIEQEVHSRDPDGLTRLFYLAQVTQAENLRIATEQLRRSQSLTTDDYRGMTMGALFWQLNSVWPGASLSVLEYGGRWKVAANRVEPMFRPLIVSAVEQTDGAVDIFVINDEDETRGDVRVRMTVHKYSEAEACANTTFDTMQEAGPTSATHLVTLPIAEILDRCKFREFEYLEEVMKEREGSYDEDGEVEDLSNSTVAISDDLEAPGTIDPAMRVFGDHRRYAAFLLFELLDSEGKVISETHLLLCEPKHAAGLADPQLKASVKRKDNTSFEIRFRAKSVALFVYLESSIEGARFSDNGFVLWGGARTVILRLPPDMAGSVGEKEVQESLTVMSYYPQKQEGDEAAVS